MARKSKRGNNEGSISLRADGRWLARISVGYDKDGKPKRKSFYGRTRQEAAEKLTAAMRTHQLGIALPNEKKTVADFLTVWLETIEGKVRPSTFRSYKGIVNNHLIPGLGRLPLIKLSPQDVTRFLKQRHNDGRVPTKFVEQKTVEQREKKTWKNYVSPPKPQRTEARSGVSAEHIRRVLRASLNQAIKWDLVPRNVASLASAPRTVKHEIKYLDPDQAKKFLVAVKGTPHEALFTVAIAVGLRLGEALGLKWSDLNLHEGMLSVRRQCQRVNGKLTFTEPKTAKARRSIPLPTFAIAALQDLWSRQQLLDKVKAGENWQDLGLVFSSRIGTPCDDRSIRRSLASILHSNGFPRMRFHDLRHSCATLLLSQGCDPRTIMETLGHSQITLTLNTYAHVIPTLQRDAADRMNELFSN